MDEPTDQAWWYARDELDDPGGAGRDATSGPGTPPALPTPTRPGPVRPGHGTDVPDPGRAAPGRHGWARSDGTYVPSVTDKGATKSIILGVVGLLICGFILGPAAIVEGVHARRRIAASGGGLSGNAEAIIGICIGAVATFLAALSAIVIIVRAMAV